MLTSTLAGMLLQPCQSHLRRSQTTDNAKEDYQGSKATTKDDTHLTKEKQNEDNKLYSPFVNKIVHFSSKVNKFHIVSRKRVNGLKINFAVRVNKFQLLNSETS